MMSSEELADQLEIRKDYIRRAVAAGANAVGMASMVCPGCERHENLVRYTNSEGKPDWRHTHSDATSDPCLAGDYWEGVLTRAGGN